MSLPCLALDETGKKLAIPLRLATGINATVHKILIRIQTILGEWPEDISFGLNWPKFGPGTQAVEIEGLVRIQLLAVQDVSEVVSVNVEKLGSNMTINALVRIQDGTGNVLVEIGSMSTAGNYPETWYNLLGVDYAQECPL
jgi:hypothetical protein